MNRGYTNEDAKYWSHEDAERVEKAEFDRRGVKYSTHDGRSPCRTGFNVHGGPNGPPKDGQGNPLQNVEKWKRLLELQEGHRWPDAKERNRAADNRRIVRTVTSQCDLPDKYGDWACDLCDSLDKRMGPVSTEVVILGIVAYVVPEEFDLFDRDRFQEFIDGFNTDQESVERIVSTIEDREHA